VWKSPAADACPARADRPMASLGEPGHRRPWRLRPSDSSGHLAHGFAHARRDECGPERLIPFSCEARASCLSYNNTWRMPVLAEQNGPVAQPLTRSRPSPPIGSWSRPFRPSCCSLPFSSLHPPLPPEGRRDGASMDVSEVVRGVEVQRDLHDGRGRRNGRNAPRDPQKASEEGQFSTCVTRTSPPAAVWSSRYGVVVWTASPLTMNVSRGVRVPGGSREGVTISRCSGAAAHTWPSPPGRRRSVAPSWPAGSPGPL